MSDGATAADRTLLVDASVLVTLADVGSLDLLASIQGTPVVPWAVEAEVRDEPARRALAIGALIRAVERGDISAEEAKAKLLAMDEVGARLSTTLLRRAEQPIEDATDR